jgi:hypothetical protein
MMQRFTEKFLAKSLYYGPIQIRFDEDFNPVSIAVGCVFPWLYVFAEAIGKQLGRFLADIAIGNKPTARFLSNCAFGMRITQPPYPSPAAGFTSQPDTFAFPSMALNHVWLSDVDKNDDRGYSTGVSGNIGTITASGQSAYGSASPLSEARRRVFRTARNFAGMGFQWRVDAGERAEAYHKKGASFARIKVNA